MRIFLLAPCLLAVACGASSTLGGDEGGQGGTSSAAPGGGGMGGRAMTGTTAEQQLGAKLPTWCPEICRTLSQCPCSCQGDVCSCVDLPDPATCRAECQSAMSEEFLGHGEACAELGLTYVDCLSAVTCQALTGSLPPCAPDSSVQAAICSPPPPAGSVSCSQGWGTGTEGPVTPGALVCEEQWEACSDGHVYRVSCYYAGTGQLSCSCLVDGVVQRGFPTASPTCPPVEVVSAGCGWQLASVG